MRSDPLNHAPAEHPTSYSYTVSSGGLVRQRKKRTGISKTRREASPAKRLSSAAGISKELAFGGVKSAAAAPSSSKNFQPPSVGDDDDVNGLVAKHKAMETQYMKGDVDGEEEDESMKRIGVGKQVTKRINDVVAKGKAVKAKERMNREYDEEEIERLEKRMFQSMNAAVARSKAMKAQKMMKGDCDGDEFERLKSITDEKEYIKRFNSARIFFSPYHIVQFKTSP